ncbi:Peroxidase [Quillaja saponaria]|uniref:Peroxidase n=1 Tax=Quillaja saponaria TaxID=32244 RepID=A0AAD7L8G5_QUISA|nr:Peroxidase [Quillaja saponaria]
MEMGRVILASLLVFYVILRPTEARPQHSEDASGLRIGFYDETCPQAEQIVADAVAKLYETNPRIPAFLVRLFFHDCFVTGCDASILLDGTPSGEPVEKNSLANGPSLRGAEFIDDIKARLEEACPETVSCADTLAFAAHDAMVLSGLPKKHWPAGRRDSETSLAANVEGNLPLPDWTVDQMIEVFVGRKGLRLEDMVALIGAHSIGGAHCGLFSNRVYNNQGNGLLNPIVNLAFLEELKGICPDPNNAEQMQQMGDPIVDFDLNKTPGKLDHSFYTNILEGKALLYSDQVLIDDERTGKFVQTFADDQKTFSHKFVNAMLRMGKIGVLTGDQGQIRKICRSVN